MFNLKRMMSFLFVVAITVLSFTNVSAASAVNIPTYTAQAYHDEAYNVFQQGHWQAFWDKYGGAPLDEPHKIIVNGKIEKIGEDGSSPFCKNIRTIILAGDVFCTLNIPTGTQLVVGQEVSIIGYPAVTSVHPLFVGIDIGKIYNGETITEKEKPMREAKKWYI